MKKKTQASLHQLPLAGIRATAHPKLSSLEHKSPGSNNVPLNWITGTLKSRREGQRERERERERERCLTFECVRENHGPSRAPTKQTAVRNYTILHRRVHTDCAAALSSVISVARTAPGARSRATITLNAQTRPGAVAAGIPV
ncbi:hypothetical protein AOLI_G00222380 [Acnodon oligacanthus]